MKENENKKKAKQENVTKNTKSSLIEEKPSKPPKQRTRSFFKPRPKPKPKIICVETKTEAKKKDTKVLSIPTVSESQKPTKNIEEDDKQNSEQSKKMPVVHEKPEIDVQHVKQHEASISSKSDKNVMLDTKPDHEGLSDVGSISEPPKLNRRIIKRRNPQKICQEDALSGNVETKVERKVSEEISQKTANDDKKQSENKLSRTEVKNNEEVVLNKNVTENVVKSTNFEQTVSIDEKVESTVEEISKASENPASTEKDPHTMGK